jgi:Protein of unknown function (DUF2630)
MDDKDVLDHISKLVAEEKELRAQAKLGTEATGEMRERIRQLEIQLDQYWDLLRRRQAREEFGQDPDLEAEQPPSVVERYQQ